MAGLVGERLAAIAISEATASEVAKQEQVVNGLLKRCQYFQAALADVRLSAAEVDKDSGNHAYFVRASLERANEQNKQLRERIKELESRLRIKSPEKKAKQRLEKKKKKKKRNSRRIAKVEQPKRIALATPTIREKRLSGSYSTEVVGTVNQARNHGRKKPVVVEKVVPRVLSRKARV